ncbi:PREDICTED: B3 domain-containing protein At5g18090-like [Camelina sativa]|uniref:B3 domain-containing protein At5g18090-like n=1 Tax=Camelina sativa TaxID=90675 RepID=A0ABM0VC77_CAMSA|nr:PREDICTED: B3 domain-containing protein At5g18090-like [Camelina sativa]
MVRKRMFGQVMEKGDNPAFFKILRKEDLSSEIMRGIPRNFIKSTSEEDLSANIVLKVSWRSSWTIRISRNLCFYYMEKKGWDKFLSDNDLGNNEYLTFTHKGHMCFSVDIYQIDGMELLRPRKSAPTVAFSSVRNKRDQRENMFEYPSSESSYLGPKTAESTGRRQTEKSKKKKMKVEIICDDSEDDTLVPEFTITIKKSYLIFLGIPKKFEKLHMPKETTMFKIYDPERETSWDVMYKFTNNKQSRFCAGWIRLAKDLGLVIGDVCTFKLVKPTEMLVTVTRREINL